MAVVITAELVPGKTHTPQFLEPGKLIARYALDY